MQRDYLITITIDGRERSGRWKLLMGGLVRVTCNWGADTMECAPQDRPEAIASILLEQIIRSYREKRASVLAEEQRAVDHVNRYWDRQQGKKAQSPRAQGLKTRKAPPAEARGAPKN